jgi:hypothetical protein
MLLKLLADIVRSLHQHHMGKWLPCRTPTHMASTILVICCCGTHYHVCPSKNVEHSTRAIVSCDLFNYKTSIFKGSKLPAKEAIASFGTKGSNFKGSNFKGSNSKGSNSKGSNSQRPHLFPPPPLRMRTTVHTIKYRRTHTTYTEQKRIMHELSVFTHLYYCSKY